MAIEPFDRFTSNEFIVKLGADREQAALNAANPPAGGIPDVVARNPIWPKLEKFDNDTSTQNFSPFGVFVNPRYIWDEPTADGQTVAFAVASAPFQVSPNELHTFSVFLVAFADNAMEVKIELFEDVPGGGFGPFAKAFPQPSGLDEFLLIAGNPNTPTEGLTETQPYNWQNIRVYSTRFAVPPPSDNNFFKIVVSFEVTNYLIPNPPELNPAGLQFIVDIYRNIDPV